MNNQLANRFITGDGEMSSLIRNFDWSKTLLGEINSWPQSLLTTLNLMLNSKFPMFLFWGPELICFYNDAYRPSLGNEGKHPYILGSRGEDYWQEIWPVIKPLIDQVLSGGEATWSEDQLIPIYRNGKMEDVFWTFSYSAVNDESGNPFGVFVTCNETTDKVNTRKKLEESERKLRLSIYQAPVGIAILKGNNYLVEIVNSRSLELWGRSEEEVINKPVLEVLPELANQGIKELLDTVYTTGVPFSAIEFPVILRHNGKLENIYVSFVYEPIYDVDGTINGIMTVGSDVTENVLARKRVEESEQRSRLAIEAAEIGTFDWDLVTNEFISSQRLNNIFGFPGQRGITHKNLIEAFHPEDRPRRDEAVKNAIAKGSLSYEARIIWPDKSTHWVKVYGKIKYEKQQPLKMYGTVIDITETKNNLSILQKSELHFKTISNVSPVGLWMTDTNAQNIFVNDTWIEWTGDPLEKQLGNGWLNRVVDEDKKDAPAKFWDSMQKRQKYITEFRIIRADGTLQWCLTEGSPYYDMLGNFAGYAGSVTDITEKKLVQEELEKKVEERTLQLRKSEERNFRMINEVQDYAILLLSREGIIENWNKGAEKIKGYTDEEAIGNHFRIFYTKQDQEKKIPEHFIEKAIKTGKATDEGWRVKKDGSTFWASIVITALHDDDNNIIGFSKVTRDLTERKKAEEKLSETNTELKMTNAALAKSNNELEQFAYVASHDLQEPLRKIRFFTERLENSMVNMPGPSKDYYLKIQKASNRMDTLIKDLLDFSRLSKSNKLFVKTDLNMVLTNIQNDFELLIQEKSAVIEIAPLPAIEAIPLQMQQLFYNLISNALKFSKKDTPPLIKISATILKRDEIISHNLDENLQYFLIEIQDNGIGFEQKYDEQIFVIFQRLNDLYSYGGTGIGLALCKKIVLNHNGIIYATGKEEEGAIFSIILPNTNNKPD